MGQPAKKLNLRQDMPETAAYVDQRRQEWGADYVNDRIRRSLNGEPNCFYAVEAGHVLGTPFESEVTPEVAALIVRWGMKFCCLLQQPSKGDGDGST